jgi:hypothetical protein
MVELAKAGQGATGGETAKKIVAPSARNDGSYPVHQAMKESVSFLIVRIEA